MKLFILTLLLFGVETCYSQRNNIWCFGDSAGIDFNNAVPVPIHSISKSRGSCCSIAGKNGSLLFYSTYNTDLFGSGGLDNGEVYNRNHQLMVNDDQIDYQS